MNSTTLQPRLVVVSGADGTGKTSLVEGLARKLRARGQHVAVASLWDLYGAPELPRMFTSREEAQRYVCGISARSRLHFFTHCLFGALDRALAARPEVLLFDAYWYKYFAGEVALGTPLHEVLEVASGLPVPEVILELDAPVEVTVQRKRQFGAYESRGSLNAFGFVSFQTALRHTLRTVVRVQPCARIELDATQPQSTSVHQALQALSTEHPAHV